MAYHATTSLSFAPPLPEFAVVETDDVAHACLIIKGRGSAHVSTRALAAETLRLLGVGPERIEDLLHFATTGEIRRHP